MADVYISYANEDRLLVEQLAAYLELEGWSVWFARDSVTNEETGRANLELKYARTVLIIWTPSSIKSASVMVEAQRAKSESKLITVKSSDVEYTSIPAPFGEMHAEPLESYELIRAALVFKLAPRFRKLRQIAKKTPRYNTGSEVEELFRGRVAEALPHHRRQGLRLEHATLVSVHYATNRAVSGEADPNLFYNSDRADLRYGVSIVSIPSDHKIGQLERPKLWRLEFQENPARHVMLREVSEMTRRDFFEHLRNDMRQLQRKAAFVFIHGFNVSFAEAARSTAQLAYDLFYVAHKNNLATLSIVPILYSWPSHGKAVRYTHDANNADASSSHLRTFLSDVAMQSGATSITIIGHSMGNRALALALNEIGLSMRLEDGPLVKEIVLAAPDVDRDVFLNMADSVARTGTRMTLYASRSDAALQLSKALNGFPRLGDATDGVVVWKGSDSIDASAVGSDIFAHSYHGEPSVLFDLYNLIMHGHPPRERFGLLEQGNPPSTYWMMRPRAGT